MIVKAGMLRHRVGVLAPSEALSEVGQPIKAWANLGTFWAKVSNVAGKEHPTQTTQQVIAESDWQVVFRSLPFTLTVAHRLTYGTDIFGIVNVNSFDDQGCASLNVATCKKLG